MKKKELDKIRSKDVEALKKEVQSLKQERDKAIADIGAGKESNLKKANLIKRNIAQYMTVITELTNKL